MTHFLQRTILMALATSAVGAPAAYGQVLQPVPLQVDAALSATDHGADAAAHRRRRHVAAAPAHKTHRKGRPASSDASSDNATGAASGKVVTVDGGEGSYTVKKGDTLDKIAKTFGTTIADLRDSNGLTRRSKLQPGDTLTIPGKSAKAYVAGSGDTLYAIGKRFGVSVEALRAENKLSRKAQLHAGEKIRLPEGYRDHGPGAKAEASAEAAETGDTERAPARASRRGSSRNAPRASETTVEDIGDGRTLTTRSVTGRVTEVEGGESSYTVRKGDTLEKIAKKLHTTVAKLRADNGLTRRTKILPGDTLAGPSTKTKAYVAESGDTAGEIARRFGVSEAALRSANGLSHRGSIRPGQKIKLPAGYHDRGPLVTSIRVPTPAAQAAETPARQTYTPPARSARTPQGFAPQYAAPQTTSPQTTSPQTVSPQPPGSRPYASSTTTRPYLPPVATTPTTPSPSDQQISQLGSGRFIWPLQGQVVSDFGPKSEGQRNDGLNIAAQGGEAVRAAAAGDVVYAGNQVPGFGNLVLIKHPDGWVTAYAHLQRVEVKNQQHVDQGQEVGLAGMTGGVTTPQLHFEIRYAASAADRAKPIDPKLVLPR